MTNQQQEARALGDPTRHAVFRRIAEARRPVAIAELVEQFALNHNAIRQHLAKLVAAGLVTETTAAASGPGRPRLMYAISASTEGRWGTPGPYERLSTMLTEVIRSGRTPEEVGRRAVDTFRVPDPTGDAVADISAAMARQGFDPEVRLRRGGADVVLHHCPFEAAVRTDRETVCSLHLGIAEGLADGSGVEVRELVANDPRRAECRIRLQPLESSGAPTTPVLTLRDGRGVAAGR